MTAEDQQQPAANRVAGIDATKPSIARTYDYLLGGKDNFAVDRALGDKFINDLPGSPAIAHTNRGVLIRAVSELVVTAGIRQFIDLGSGLPTADNVHQVAQRHQPDARVVYVDNDPVVLAHGRALLEDNENTTVFRADLRDSEAIFASPATRELIDFDQPVAVIFSAILHHINDDENPADLVKFWVDRIVPESYVFISHFRSEDDPRSAQMQELLQGSLGRGRWRTDEEILALFGDRVEVLPPGLVPAKEWRPTEPVDELTDWERLIAAAVAVKV
ncbi:S-adenosyl methyltransferase [Kribbella amoyensis]|uniref:S-adenosyl methyltransferase n=1 Tax=Kribbella amoyensis TaxID=996641 RepID=A0A561B6U1_9ACTN|nr:SAM-dependent methyltransferase [Kribbella amoyensis]TWD74704.1 S-adenosyl methyltransferase [Kribbella amoyensis]